MVDHESISDTRASYSFGDQLKNYNCSFLRPDNPLYKKFNNAAFLPRDVLQINYLMKRNSEGMKLMSMLDMVKIRLLLPIMGRIKVFL